jgi:hypothetical protein
MTNAAPRRERHLGNAHYKRTSRRGRAALSNYGDTLPIALNSWPPNMHGMARIGRIVTSVFPRHVTHGGKPRAMVPAKFGKFIVDEIEK